MEATWIDVGICLKLWGKFAIMKTMLLFSINLCKLFPRVPDLLKPSSTSYNKLTFSKLKTSIRSLKKKFLQPEELWFSIHFAQLLNLKPVIITILILHINLCDACFFFFIWSSLLYFHQGIRLSLLMCFRKREIKYYAAFSCSYRQAQTNIFGFKITR